MIHARVPSEQRDLKVNRIAYKSIERLELVSDMIKKTTSPRMSEDSKTYHVIERHEA